MIGSTSTKLGLLLFYGGYKKLPVTFYGEQSATHIHTYKSVEMCNMI